MGESPRGHSQPSRLEEEPRRTQQNRAKVFWFHRQRPRLKPADCERKGRKMRRRTVPGPVPIRRRSYWIWLPGHRAEGSPPVLQDLSRPRGGVPWRRHRVGRFYSPSPTRTNQRTTRAVDTPREGEWAGPQEVWRGDPGPPPLGQGRGVGGEWGVGGLPASNTVHLGAGVGPV
ncbi:unnamed protein product [Gadus morhua 'NCC']